MNPWDALTQDVGAGISFKSIVTHLHVSQGNALVLIFFKKTLEEADHTPSDFLSFRLTVSAASRNTIAAHGVRKVEIIMTYCAEHGILSLALPWRCPEKEAIESNAQSPDIDLFCDCWGGRGRGGVDGIRGLRASGNDLRRGLVKSEAGSMTNFRGKEGRTASCLCKTSFIIQIRVDLGGGCGGEMRDAKVADFDGLAVFSPKQIRRFDITVDNSLVMHWKRDRVRNGVVM